MISISDKKNQGLLIVLSITPSSAAGILTFNRSDNQTLANTISATSSGFLEQLGLVGGASLVMTAMNSWELMAGQAQGRPQLTGKLNDSPDILHAGYIVLIFLG